MTDRCVTKSGCSCRFESGSRTKYLMTPKTNAASAKAVPLSQDKAVSHSSAPQHKIVIHFLFLGRAVGQQLVSFDYICRHTAELLPSSRAHRPAVLGVKIALIVEVDRPVQEELHLLLPVVVRDQADIERLE